MYEKLIVMRAKKKQKDILHVTYAGQGEFYLLNVIRTYMFVFFIQPFENIGPYCSSTISS